MKMSERKLLQLTVVLSATVPIGAGIFGSLDGISFFDLAGTLRADSNVRYLSGLLLGIGLAFAASAYKIEQHTQRFLLLGSIVALGGFVRLLAALNNGTADSVVIFGLIMEVGVTPLVCAWQARFSASKR
jgi:hypothetical protein